MPEEVPFTSYAEVNPKRDLKRGQEYPFVEMASLPEGGGELQRIRTRVFDGQGSRFAIGDTLFARITPCTENGKTSIVRDLNGSGVGFGSTEFIVLAARHDSDPEFVHQVAVAPTVRAAAVSRMLGTSGRQRVPTWFFEDELRLPRFDRREQAQIGATLKSIDSAIERTEDVIAATEKVRKALLQDLLTRGVPGWHSEWKTVPGIGTIPACWDVVKLGEVLERIDAGRSPNCQNRPAVDGEWGVLKVSAVSWTDFLPGENKALPEGVTPDSRMEVQLGDVIVSRANTPGLVGRSVYVRATRPRLLLCDKTLRLVPSVGQLEAQFLNYLLTGEYVRAQIESAATGTSMSMKNISQESLRSLRVARPPVEEQRRALTTITALDRRLDDDRQLVTRLRAIKRETASALLSGRVPVEVVDA